MIGLYYRIWMDFIRRVRLQPAANRQNWKIRCMIGMTLAMVFNFVLIIDNFGKDCF